MVATCSPHRDAGGTLHLPSPTGMHHVDASSAIRQLRRSLSRSPSKSSDFRFLPSRIHSQSPSKLLISSPLSPSRRASQGNLFLIPTSHAIPVAVPYSLSAKINRPPIRRLGFLQPTRARASSKSPSKRALSISNNQGNMPPVSSGMTLVGGENMPDKPSEHVEKSVSESTGNLCVSNSIENSLEPKPVGRVEKRRSGNFSSFIPSISPLKRSDGIMNLDQVGIESPLAKRRSLHGTAFGSDFSIFDCHNSEKADADSPPAPVQYSSAGPFATIPRRSSSLRRSTLQQRQNERSLFSRPRLSGDYFDPPSADSAAITRHRLSLDNDLSQSPGVESPFPAPSALSSKPSIFSSTKTGPAQTPHMAHPLSRAITQSSSSSSVGDDSPTHEPAYKGERLRQPFNFSKSLPLGATRPVFCRQSAQEDLTPSSDAFATPENYKLVKPLPAAFMSTGLISKKNRNAEDSRNSSEFGKNMPDTPCKRSTSLLPSAQQSLLVRPIEKPKLVRQSLATSSTPFNSQFSQPIPGPFTRGAGIFGNVSNKPNISRRGSFVSINGDDQSLSQSPSTRHDSQSTTESDLPPTPTKLPLVSPGDQFLFESQAVAKELSPRPLNVKFERSAPQTPKDGILPPDHSRLSISAPNESPLSKHDSSFTLPATPTAPRGYFTLAGKRASLPLGGYRVSDIDSSLTSRFDSVELIGTGEFSQVYRVSKSPTVSPYNSIFSLTMKPPSAILNRVWAVKKSKHPYAGAWDRQHRICEVDILKALVNSDHVISFVDSWEDRGHLYIQTEFCEEGSLDVFLAQVGLKARLDDFRIWKILLELSLGLKRIHDLGFIHLDLKPANVLITFEGVLKIADFGMATPWPAEEGIEGEGDREYIGPEILMGRYDKPADIFALGLIMFEIAGNVELPDNGLSWQKLRNGDMSDVPSLTWSTETSIFRDASGNPLPEESPCETLISSEPGEDSLDEREYRNRLEPQEQKGVRLAQSGELVNPPNFMVNAADEYSLDKLVRWMISPEPQDRPVADQLLRAHGIQWAERRRRAGATVFEGNWGPADEVLAEDAEMIDV